MTTTLVKALQQLGDNSTTQLGGCLWGADLRLFGIPAVDGRISRSPHCHSTSSTSELPDGGSKAPGNETGGYTSSAHSGERARLYK